MVTLVFVLSIVLIVLLTQNVMGQTRNSRRFGDINTLMYVVYEQAIAEDGFFHENIPTMETEICRFEAVDCTDFVDMSFLTDEGLYLNVIPTDPIDSTLNGSGYTIYKDAFDRIVLQAPHAELGSFIYLIK